MPTITFQFRVILFVFLSFFFIGNVKAKTVTSISWIDEEGLPSTTIFQKDLLLWPYKVAVGLTGTSNTRPPRILPGDFKQRKQYRALIHYTIDDNDNVSNVEIDPGWTPPFEMSKAPGIASAFAYWADEGVTSPGTKSDISSVVISKLHPSSTLFIPDGAVVITSALIKFRAGDKTNQIGITKANSPYHVPWVWSEHALIRYREKLALIANGSRFPSHAWYVDGSLVGMLIQKPVVLNESEPALSTGAPRTQTLPPASDQYSTGPVSKHKFTLGKIRNHPIVINLKD